MSDWNLSQDTVTAKSWNRSWRQEFFTDLGSDFLMVAHMENVTATEPSGKVVHERLGQVIRKASAVASDPRVQQLQSLLTELIAEWAVEDGLIPPVN